MKDRSSKPSGGRDVVQLFRIFQVSKNTLLVTAGPARGMMMVCWLIYATKAIKSVRKSWSLKRLLTKDLIPF